MIPVEVTLSNFLGYDDNEGDGYTYNFADHRLWSISGDNGAGKSAIFDAITYCLFGRHRGGAQRDEELLHKGASDMSCSFTFDHFGVRYCVRRTLTKRTRRTGKIMTEKACQLDWYDADEAAWRAIDGTTSVAGLEEYVRTRLLGFDYDTFIASVLLLQGQSDKLISAYPAQRFDYLSGILEFDRYRRLYARSEDRVRDLRARHEILLHQLGRVDMPSDQQLQEAKTTAIEAEDDHAKASSCHRQQQQRHDRVKHYHELADRQRQLTSDVQQAEAAIEHAAEIRAAAEMWGKLRVALPLVKSAYAEICDAAAADESAAAAKANADRIDLAQLEAAMTTAAEDLDTAQVAHDTNARELRQCRRELEHLQPLLNLAHRLNELDAQITAGVLRVDSLAEHTAALATVSAQRERLDRLYRCLTSIQAYVHARKSRDELLAGRTPAALEMQLEQAVAENAAALAAVDGLVNAVGDRRERIAALKERHETVRAEREQRVEAGDEGTCSRCGQPVSPEHIQAELERCTAELARVENEIGVAESELASNDGQLQAARTKLSTLAADEQQARDQLQRFTERQAEIDRLDAAPFMAELPDDCHNAVLGPLDVAVTALAGWEKDVGGLNQVAAECDRLRALDADRHSQEQLIAVAEGERNKHLEQITREQAQAALESSAALADKVHDHEAHEAVLAAEVRARADAMDRARTVHSEAQVTKAKLEAEARSSAVEAAAKRRSADQLVAAVEPEFRPPTLERIQELEGRFEQLADAQAKLDVLKSAESEVALWRGQLVEAGEAIAKVAEAERVPLVVAATELQAAQQAEAAADVARTSARDGLKEMLRVRTEHDERQKEADRVDGQRQVWQRVARLLGRSGLQLALLKRDLREIERRANPFLQRISGGSLSLWIECTEGRANREEIHFRCFDAASADDPLDVVFLSGGQKFRVAVALAAGIGQYAGLGASMPSQIIDEGFGSLDEMGRKEMLEAIRDMSEHYERIIVVSHTDSFHDPSLFPARYELRKDGRRTLVSATV